MGGSGSLSTHLLSSISYDLSLSSLISLTQTIFNNVALPTPQESRPLSRSPPPLKLKKMGFSSLTKAWQAVWLSDLNFIWLNCMSAAIVAITPSVYLGWECLQSHLWLSKGSCVVGGVNEWVDWLVGCALRVEKCGIACLLPPCRSHSALYSLRHRIRSEH